MNVKRLLFVCTGNSCRSVMAQWLLHSLLQRAGLDSVQVDSAGVFAVEGMGPTRETQRVLLDHGVDCAAHRARAVTAELVDGADLILVMESFHQEELARRFPAAREKIHLLRRFGCAAGEGPATVNIPDPIGKPLEVYEVCFADILDAVERLARSLGART